MLTKCFYIFFSFLCLAGFSSFSYAAQHKTQIKSIVFDFGGVIAKSNHDEIAQFIANSLNLSVEEAVEASVELKKQMTQGVKEGDFWITYANSKGKTLPKDWMDQLNEARFRSLKTIPGMVSLVKNLQNQGFQTALLSNVRQSQAQIKSKLGYYELFEPVLFSYEIGVSKPDPKAYSILLERLKLPPEVVLFIDNKASNIEAAKAAGMDAILFIDAQQLIRELKQRGIEVSLSDN